MRRLDLTGEKFGKLTIVGPAPNRRHDATTWLLRCECGQEATRTTRHLRSGKRMRCSNCESQTPLAQRLWSKVQTGGVDDCWPWLGWRHPAGHGQIGRGARSDGLCYAHVAAWEAAHGPVPAGACVCHSCDNPPCCNPRHLFLGSHQDNMVDMLDKHRHSFGEHHPNAKLTSHEVLAIRTLRSQGRTQQSLAVQFGVSRSLIGHIDSRKRWALL